MILARSDDNTPNTIDTGTRLAVGDATCDNTLQPNVSQPGAIPLCQVCNDTNACTTDTCNQANNTCAFTPTGTCDDTNACTSDACNPANGACTFTPTGTCNDNNTCTDDACNPASGQCEFTPNDLCGTEICRTPGFWATHARTSDKGAGARNLTQFVINLGGGSLSICGECINATVPINNAASAVEALCVPVRGDQRLQLARQLTAAALNCIVSNGQSDCVGTSIEDLFADCNTNVCLGGDTQAVTECINKLDCFNNGFEPGDGVSCGAATGCHNAEVGFCKVGNNLSNTFCSDNEPCANPNASCVPGTAGSSDDCNAAISSSCTVIGPGEATCGTDSCP
jgi:hypothetical protein